MQVGESISPEMIAEIAHDESCYFCKSRQEPKEEANDLDDDPDDDSRFEGLEEEGVRFKNDSSKLGKAIGGTPPKRQIKADNAQLPSSVAAHHLIPGNAALKNSKFFLQKKYLWTSGKAKGNIGYNVNSRPNGVWLPGNYSMRGKWRNRSPAQKENYAFKSIEKWSAQFHDAHVDYSDLVRKSLDAVFNKLEERQSIICPDAKKKKKKKSDELSPMYVLVLRFHTISERMRRKLAFPVNKWFRNVFTSAFSLKYMNNISPPKRRSRRR